MGVRVPVGVLEGMGVLVGVRVPVGVLEGIGVLVGLGVEVGIFVGVGVGLAVGLVVGLVVGVLVFGTAVGVQLWSEALMVQGLLAERSICWLPQKFWTRHTEVTPLKSSRLSAQPVEVFWVSKLLGQVKRAAENVPLPTFWTHLSEESVNSYRPLQVVFNFPGRLPPVVVLHLSGS